ncbi:MAG: N-acetylmuramoyl-L-alanine amidase [Clostridia bacterium]|nr:N-acetylmuramoyl-L-alanine amidase [Clostridia bacterium]
MKIIDVAYKWAGAPQKRNSTKYIILHHRAGTGDAESIHRGHLNNGWCGIGYHFYVRKDGSIYRGRPIATEGAHCTGYNKESIGVCFEGNFENDEMMPLKQKNAGKQLISHLLRLYPKAIVKRHKDFSSTACPGKNFPFDEIKKGECDMTVEEAVEIIQAKAGIEDGTVEFLLCYKYGEELLLKLAEAMA